MTRAHLLSTGLVLAGLASSALVQAQGVAPPPTAPPAAAPAPAPQPYPPYPPQPGYPPAAGPAYGPPPGYVQDPNERWRFVPAPTELRFVEGRPIPAGYHLETRARKGLVVAGPIVFGVPYFLSLSTAASSGYQPDRWLYAPVVGPFVDLANRKEDCTISPGFNGGNNYNCGDDSVARFFLMFDGLMQVSGVAMLIFGLALPQQVLVRDDAPFVGSKSKTFAWSIAPQTFGRSGYGVGMAAIF